ncbi:MAG: CotH kinase family protein [Rikenellaceae bacterium]|nr:CotH kinase family protein [Rikenellaceae bacterium]
MNKKINHLLVRLFMALLLVGGAVSCVNTPPVEEDEPQLTVSTMTLDYDWIYSEQSFEVSSLVDFTISTNADWLSFDQTEFTGGNYVVTVAAEKNPRELVRETMIFITPLGGEPQTISVYQMPNGRKDMFEVVNKRVEVDSRSQQTSFKVNSGMPFSAISSSDWISLPVENFSAGDGVEVVVEVERNFESATREGKVSVKTDKGNWIDVIIEQEPFKAMMSVPADTLTIDGNHGTLSFAVKSDVPFTVTAEVDWVKVDSTIYSASDTSVVTLKVERNMLKHTRATRLKIDGGSARLIYYVWVRQGENIPAVDNNITKISLLKELNPTLGKDFILTPDENGVFSCHIPARKQDSYVHISGKDVLFPEIRPFDIENVVITFESDAEKVYMNNQLLTSGESVCDLSNFTTIKAVAESGDVRTYPVKVTYFTGLPIMYINLDSNGEVASRDFYEGGTIHIVGAGDIPGLPEQRFEIHGRGNSSWGTFRKKPSYTFKLDKAQEVGGMPEHKKWVMIGNYRDKTLLRNQVAWWCSERLPALKWTPRYQQMELVLNGMHRGVYQVTEQVRIGENRVNIANMLPTDTEGEAITGGYIVEFHYGGDADQWGWDMPYMRGNSGAAVKVPKIEDSNTAQRDYIMNYVMTIDNWFASGENLEELMETYIDIPSWVAQWLVFEISGTTEPQGPNSWYTYKQRNDDKWYCGPAWDFDYRSYLPSTGNRWVNAAVMYMPEMLRYRPFKDELVRQWRTYLEPVLPDLLKYIEEQCVYLKRSEDANWAIHDQNLIDDNRHENGDENIPWEDAVDRMIQYLNYKWAHISKNITSL